MSPGYVARASAATRAAQAGRTVYVVAEHGVAGGESVCTEAVAVEAAWPTMCGHAGFLAKPIRVKRRTSRPLRDKEDAGDEPRHV